MREVLARYRVDLILFVGSLAAYALSSDGFLAHQSLAPHFVYQADAFLHGQLALAVPRPPNLNDWVLRDGRWDVSFPPFPALLMVPFVALFGLSFNDVTFTLFFSAANVALLYRLLRRIQPDRAGWEHVSFALIYGFGTLAWSCGIRGEVWYTAETIGVTLTLLYLHAALGARHPILAGLAVACAAITRAPLAFSAVFFLFEALSPDGPVEWGRLRDPARWRAALPKLVPYALAIGAVAVPMAWMNHARFGSFGEFGHSHLYANRVNEQVRRYGLFHYAFLERTLHDAFTRLPEIQLRPFRIGFNGEGMSLFVTTPLLRGMRALGEIGATAVVPVHGAPPVAEALCAYYAPEALAVCSDLLTSGERRAGALWEAMPSAVTIPERVLAEHGEPTKVFLSVDTPEQLEELGGEMPRR